MPVGKSGFESG